MVKSSYCHVLDLILCSLVSVTAQYINRQPLSVHEHNESAEFRVAIIGAGIAGTSAAYHIRKLAEANNGSLHIEVAIYESSHQTGEQVQYIAPPDHGHTGLEAGARQFMSEDWCLTDIVNRTGLDWHQDLPWLWDIRSHSRKLLREAINRKIEAWQLDRSLNFMPQRFRELVSSYLGKWKESAQAVTFDNVTNAPERIGSADALLPATEFLAHHGIDANYQSVYLEPCTRDAYGRDLEDTTGLELLMSAGALRAAPVSACGGNSRIVDRMTELSKTMLHLNTTVLRVTGGK
ncbi:putative Prenylcysteine lyase domain-containing protein [Seiridium unicorne]|uniref:Prenylcysteine lyase domain-containing protein n=1 Tax=Seiridium unicorne TaxID=138068 RepID=A0ABR2V2Y2_9PEZI